MGKHQNRSIPSYVFLFLSLISQINGITSHTHSLNHINAIRRVSGPSTTSGINQTNLKDKDLIETLPGQPPVSFKQYGGYVPVNETTGRFFYYYFAEATKPTSSTPLVVWFNGGPGCSSLGGAFMENGPFRTHSDGKTLYKNPYSWNNEAHMLYVESPALVGFSYTNTLSDLDNEGDKSTAEDNYVFILNWLERFPEYKGRDFYISAESYGGHYGPQLAQTILARNANNPKTFIKLRGVLIGNPTLDKDREKKGEREFLVKRGLVSEDILARYNKNCDLKDISTHSEYENCNASMQEIRDLTKNLNLRNIYSDVCLNSTLTNTPKEDTTITKLDPCSPHYLDAYLNRDEVQVAMHANHTTKLPYLWKKCNGRHETWPEEDIETSILPILKELMGQNLRVIVFSGEVDPSVPITSTMYAIEKLNPTVEKVWRAWFSQGEVGGYIEEYKGNFAFVTVRGAGHYVPSDQPARALTLFISFVRHTPLPLM
ncbi:unnamed protein product [Cochlearia groenlandica]